MRSVERAAMNKCQDELPKILDSFGHNCDSNTSHTAAKMLSFHNTMRFSSRNVARSLSAIHITHKNGSKQAKLSGRTLRALSTAKKSTHASEEDNMMDTHQNTGMSTRLPGGIPDFIEKWNPALFHQVSGCVKVLNLESAVKGWLIQARISNKLRHEQVGYGLGAASVASLGILANDMLHPALPATIIGFTAIYWKVGTDDLKQTNHTLRNNFPFLCHMRYLFERYDEQI